MKSSGPYFAKFSLTLISILMLVSCSSTEWPDDLITVPEKTNYEATSMHVDVMAFISALEKHSSLVYVETMAVSMLGKEVPLVVIADPPVTSPEEARESGKTVVYLQGNIHAGEVEGKEALMQIMREVALGDKKDLLKNQILLFCPIFNADGNDKVAENNRRSQEGSPKLVGERRTSEGYDLNRDAIKAQAIETKALIKNVLLKWDPVLLLDMHTTNGTWHGYALTFAPPYTPTSHPGPQGYVLKNLLPDVRKRVKDNYDIDMFWYGGFSLRDGWPPKVWHQGGYSGNAWFVVNYTGLRNRMGVLSETFAHDPFEKRIASAKAFALSIIEYSAEHGSEMAMLCRNADTEVTLSVRNKAGRMKKGVSFDVEAYDDPVDILVYDHELNPDADTVSTEAAGQSYGRGPSKYRRKDNIITIKNVKNNNKFLAIQERTVPKGYIIPAALKPVADKLIEHGIKVTQLESGARYRGEEFLISKFQRIEAQRYRMSYVDIDGMYASAEKTFPAGSYIVDLAQPLAFLAFYMLEPEVRDGLVMWNYYDEYLKEKGVNKRKVPFPVFKYYEIIK